MSEQLSIFDIDRRPRIEKAFECDAPVLQGEIDTLLCLPHPTMAWDRASIELHPDADGHWMWATSYQCDSGGSGYRIGGKWGNFAHSREDALYYAVTELRAAIKRRAEVGHEGKIILDWLDSLGA